MLTTPRAILLGLGLIAVAIVVQPMMKGSPKKFVLLAKWTAVSPATATISFETKELCESAKEQIRGGPTDIKCLQVS